MGATAQRKFASIGLIGLTVLFVVLWLLGWFVFQEPSLTEPSFYMAGIFLASTLLYFGIRGSIYE